MWIKSLPNKESFVWYLFFLSSFGPNMTSLSGSSSDLWPVPIRFVTDKNYPSKMNLNTARYRFCLSQFPLFSSLFISPFLSYPSPLFLPSIPSKSYYLGPLQNVCASGFANKKFVTDKNHSRQINPIAAITDSVFLILHIVPLFLSLMLSSSSCLSLPFIPSKPYLGPLQNVCVI